MARARKNPSSQAASALASRKRAWLSHAMSRRARSSGAPARRAAGGMKMTQPVEGIEFAQPGGARRLQCKGRFGASLDLLAGEAVAALEQAIGQMGIAGPG